MPVRSPAIRRGMSSATAALACLIAALRPTTSPAQDAAPPPPQAPAAAPATPPADPASAPARSREELLEERLQRMETMNRQLADRLEELGRQYTELQGRVGPASGGDRPAPGGETRSPDNPGLGPSSGAGPGASRPGGDERADLDAGPGPAVGRPSRRGIDTNGDGVIDGYDTNGDGVIDEAPGPDDEVRRGAPGLGPSDMGPGGASARSEDRDRAGAKKEKKRILGATLDPGPVWESEDEEFRLEFHNLTQAEYRGFTQSGTVLHSQFFIPRQRWYFTGRVNKAIEFYTVINRGYSSLDLLDAFINVNYDRRLQFRIGRMKTPFAYEYWQIAEGDLIAPERSLYVSNLSGNREEGAMFHGQVFDRRAEWALGVFNGPRRSFGDFNDAKDGYAYLNARPFQESERLPALKYLNLGGGYNTGIQQGPIQPSTLSTANDQTSGTNAESVSPTFLIFNNNALNNGWRAHWNAHAVWYYESLGVLAEYEGGFETLSAGANGARVKVPNQGYNLQAWYFVTGETLTRRVNVVKPKKDFDVKGGRITGPGAVEVHARFSELNMGNQVFTGGLADGNVWSNSAYITDVGANWYPNEYTKVYLDWQHAVFGRPVAFRSGELSKTQNILWLRFQLYF